MASVEGYDIPDYLYFTKEHLWLRVERNDRVRVGLAAIYANTKGDIIFVDLPQLDDDLEPEDVCGRIQSRDWMGRITAPVSGRVVEANEALEEDTRVINRDPYGEGWLFVMEPHYLEEDIKRLMDVRAFEQWVRDELSQEP